MTSIYIESEGDIEDTIKQCKSLAKIDGRKHITLAFPSKFLYTVFINNLHTDLLKDKSIPPSVNIECDVILPPWETQDD
jgi:hypothetical protein